MKPPSARGPGARLTRSWSLRRPSVGPTANGPSQYADTSVRFPDASGARPIRTRRGRIDMADVDPLHPIGPRPHRGRPPTRHRINLHSHAGIFTSKDFGSTIADLWTWRATEARPRGSHPPGELA